VDFIGQRLMEIWSNIPFIYVVMIVASIVTPSLLWLVVITLIFSWPGLASYIRTLAFSGKTHDYIAAALIAGAPTSRILARHILPQMTPLLLTFLPFQAAGAITTLTSLDFLGFGLRPPAASWGELLRVGSGALHAPWIVSSVVVAMTVILVLLTMVGNSLREAFDAKTAIRYK
jgi:microcin C transport system permease protein